ncbi:MAG: EAL domain-containing protein [Lachnospiraceae bacterium]|nr:EAL domain-containing protein [Lachnospiraceae bacterium]
MSDRPSGTYVIDEEYRVVHFNNVVAESYPQMKVGEKCYKLFMDMDSPCPRCPVHNGVVGPHSYEDPMRHTTEMVDAVEVTLEDGRLGHAIVFNTLEEGQHTLTALPASEGEVRLLGVVNVLSSDINDLYSVNVETGKVTAYRTTGDAEGIYEKLQRGDAFDALIEAYITHNVYVEDQDTMRRVADIEFLTQELHKKESVIYHYRVSRKNEIHYFYLKCARVGEADDFKHIVIAFIPEDNDVSRKKIQEVISTRGQGFRRKILVIEDDLMNRTMLREFLEEAYDVIDAADGEEGMAILRDKYQEISLVMLDLNMPKMSGYEFLEITQKNALLSTVPIVVMTGEVARELEEKCLDLGAIDFFMKPYDPTIVIKRISNLIQMKESVCTLNQIEVDDLTGLYTRQAFYHHAKQMLDAQPDASFDIAIIDVDDFKLINSIYGQKKGDKVLNHLAEYIDGLVSQGICGRFDGDKFVILAKHDGRYSREWLLRALDGVSQNAPIPHIELSCGVYVDVDRQLTISAMCDRALLAAKSVKGDFEERYATYDGPVSTAHLRKKLFESQFHTAIENEEFVIWYQPKFDTKTEKLVGAEALVRWQMQDGSFVPPGEFIPVFEEDGRIVKLDEYVFRKVCQYVKYWMDKGATVVPISVNLSRASLHHRGTVERYKAIVEEVGIPAKYVPLELTESATIYNTQIQELLSDLQGAGFQLHLDDFGVGVSSLASFNILPLDAIKLDKSLIDLIGDAGGDELLKHTIDLAHFKGMKVVAEGVEEKYQLDFLKELDCDVIQGYYFSPPKNYKDVIALFKQMLDEDRVQA